MLLDKNSKKERQVKEPEVIYAEIKGKEELKVSGKESDNEREKKYNKEPIYADLNELGINESPEPELPTRHPILDKNEKVVEAKEKEILKKDAYKKEGNKFIRSEEEIKRQIDLVLNSGKNIPPEHLQEFVSRLLTNKDKEKLENLNGITIENAQVTNISAEDDNRLAIFYSKVTNKFERNRERMNNELIRKLSSSEELGNIILGEKLKTQEDKKEFIKKYNENPEALINEITNSGIKIDEVTVNALADVIQKTRKDTFEKVTKLPYENATIKIVDNDTGSLAGYSNGEIKIDLNKVTSLEKALDSLLHENVHLEQDIIRKNPSQAISESVRDLYNINHSQGGYIKAGENQHTNIQYMNQPVEAEAFYAMRANELIKKIIANTVKKLEKETNDGKEV